MYGEKNINVHGTTGLPVFGNTGIDYAGRKEIIGSIDKGFQTLLTTVKTSMAVGNEIALLEFSAEFEKAYWLALKTVAGKAVVNA